jgi:hypothetical protein
MAANICRLSSRSVSVRLDDLSGQLAEPRRFWWLVFFWSLCSLLAAAERLTAEKKA